MTMRHGLKGGTASDTPSRQEFPATSLLSGLPTSGLAISQLSSAGHALILHYGRLQGQFTKTQTPPPAISMANEGVG